MLQDSLVDEFCILPGNRLQHGDGERAGKKEKIDQVSHQQPTDNRLAFLYWKRSIREFDLAVPLLLWHMETVIPKQMFLCFPFPGVFSLRSFREEPSRPAGERSRPRVQAVRREQSVSICKKTGDTRLPSPVRLVGQSIETVLY